MTWNPIETAPKFILLDIWVKAKNKGESTRFTDMTLLEDDTWFGSRRLYPSDKVTHWMLPPKPPKNVKQDTKA